MEFACMLIFWASSLERLCARVGFMLLQLQHTRFLLHKSLSFVKFYCITWAMEFSLSIYPCIRPSTYILFCLSVNLLIRWTIDSHIHYVSFRLSMYLSFLLIFFVMCHVSCGVCVSCIVCGVVCVIPYLIYSMSHVRLCGIIRKRIWASILVMKCLIIFSCLILFSACQLHLVWFVVIGLHFMSYLV